MCLHKMQINKESFEIAPQCRREKIGKILKIRFLKHHVLPEVVLFLSLRVKKLESRTHDHIISLL